jgi:hypothetical protein
LKLNEWRDLICVRQLLKAQVLNFLLELHGAVLEDGRLKLVPWQTSELTTLFAEVLIDLVDH